MSEDGERREGRGEEERDLNEEEIEKALRETVKEPETGINVVDLGLIQRIGVKKEGGEAEITVDMIMAAPNLPSTGSLAGEVERVLRREFSAEVEVTLLAEPDWSPDVVSPEVRAKFQRRWGDHRKN